MSTEQTIREEVATCTRILVMKELIGLYGHVSRYDPDTKRIARCGRRSGHHPA